MATALEVINKALSLIGAKDAYNDADSVDIATGIESLNDLMMTLDADGIKLGYQKVSAQTDEIGVPDWALSMVKYNLAMALAPEYGKAVPASVAVIGQGALEIARSRTVEWPNPDFPNTLPVGSGNECEDFPVFFQDTTDNDLKTESGQGLGDGRSRQLDIEVEE